MLYNLVVEFQDKLDSIPLLRWEHFIQRYMPAFLEREMTKPICKQWLNRIYL